MKLQLFILMNILFMMLSSCELDGTMTTPEGESSSSEIISYSSSDLSSSSNMDISTLNNLWLGDTSTNKNTVVGYPKYPTDTSMYDIPWGTSVDSFKNSCARTGYVTPEIFSDASDSIKLEVSIGWCYIDSTRTIYFANKVFGTIASLSLYYSHESISDYFSKTYTWYDRIGRDAPPKYTESDTSMLIGDTNVMTTVRNFYYNNVLKYNGDTVRGDFIRSYGSFLDRSGYSPEIVFYRMYKTDTVRNTPYTHTTLSDRWFMLFFSDKWVEYKEWLETM